MWATVFTVGSAVLVIAGYVYYKLREGATAQTTVEDQTAELERQRKKLEAEQAARRAQELAEQKEREAEYERIRAIEDAAERERQALEALRRATERRRI